MMARGMRPGPEYSGKPGRALQLHKEPMVGPEPLAAWQWCAGLACPGL